jgi:hypothetical protein
VRDGLAAGVGEGRTRGRDLARPFRGVRTADGEPRTLRELCAAYRARSPESHVFSHATAARLWRIDLPFDLEATRILHVAVFGRGALPRATGVIGHRIVSSNASVVLRHGHPTTDAATTWLQLATLLRHDDLVAAGDHLILVPAQPTPGEIRPYLEFEDLARRTREHRGPGAPLARRALSSVRQGAESRRESLLRLAMLRAGLPEPALNQTIYDANGRFLGRADMVYRAQRVIVEYDGEQHRTDSRQYHRDLERLDGFRDCGWRVIVVRRHHDIPARIARIREALAHPHAQSL